MHKRYSLLGWALVGSLLLALLLPAGLLAGSPPSGTNIVNRASVSYIDVLGNTRLIQSNDAVTGVSAFPVLAINKTASPDPVAPGSLVTYTITYENTGSAAATNVTVTDHLSVEVASPVISGGGVYTPGPPAGGSITWNLGNLPAGAKGTLTVTVTVNGALAVGSTFMNKVTIKSTEGASAEKTITTSVGSAPNIKLTAAAPVTVNACGYLPYNITYANSGNTPSTLTQIRHTLPDGVSVNPSAITGGGRLEGRTLVWDLGTVSPGVQGQLDFQVAVSPLVPVGTTLRGSSVIVNREQGAVALQELQSTVTGLNSTVSMGQLQSVDQSGQDKPILGVEEYLYLQLKAESFIIKDVNTVSISVVLPDGSTLNPVVMQLSEDPLKPGVLTGKIKVKDLGAVKRSKITIAYNPGCGAPVEEIVLVDPLGTVFNTGTGAGINGVTVTLIDNATGLPAAIPAQPATSFCKVNPCVTGSSGGVDGFFQWETINPGTYRIVVSPIPTFVVPSVIPNPDLRLMYPAKVILDSGSKGEPFTVKAGDPPLNLDLPVDPPSGILSVTKTGNKTSASIGDIVQYTITVNNTGVSAVNNATVVDSLPHGVRYLNGSTSLNGVRSPDPTASGRSITWQVGTIPGGGTTTITHKALIGVDSQRGGGKNVAYAQGRSVGATVTSNVASFTIKINEGVFTSNGTIIGKVFVDHDGSGLQRCDGEKGTGRDCKDQGKYVDIPDEEEPGVPNVVLYLEDGTRVITDRNGKYSITGVRPGTHVLRLDETSLPPDIVPVPISNRNMGTGSTQFVDMVPGGLFKANFGLRRKPGTKPGVIRIEKGTGNQPGMAVANGAGAGSAGSGGAVPGSAGSGEGSAPILAAPVSVSAQTAVKVIEGGPQEQKVTEAAGPAPAESHSEPANIEEQIKTMQPDLEFLEPIHGGTIPRHKTKVRIKAPMDAQLSLQVNGKPVAEKSMGKKVEYAAGKVAVYEYVSIELLPGIDNSLRVEIRDAFGNVRSEKEITVYAVGDPEKVLIKPDRKEIPADGVSVAEVTISVVDKQGRRLVHDKVFTVETTAGELLGKDADPGTEGFQVVAKGGEAVVRIQAPRETNEAKVTVLWGDLKETTSIYFLPHLRGMIIVGVGEVMIGHGSTSGDYNLLRKKQWFEKGDYAGGRGAFFLKGKVFNDMLLTASYDSAKEKEDELFRAKETNLESEDKYPIYGDESKQGYEAQSQDKLYVKLEKDKSYALYGDYQTELTDTRLSAYTRSFTGLKLDVNKERFRFRTFGTYTDQMQVVYAQPGKGISGYYYLDPAQVMEGTERVAIETRDRLLVDKVIKRELKSRGSDYEIDYDTGAILFKEPVPSRDSDFNPIYIVVSYETKQIENKYYTYGARGSLKLTKWLEVGATGITEEKQAGDYHLLGSDITLHLPRNTTFKAEYGQTESLFDISSVLERKKGSALSFELESKPLANLSVSGYYRNLGKYFNNLSAVDVMRGSIKYGAEAKYQWRPDLSFYGKYSDESDNLNNMYTKYSLLGAEKRFTKTKVNVDISQEKSTSAFVLPTSPTSRYPFDVSEEQADQVTSARVGVERQIIKDLSFLLSHKHDIEHDRYFISQAGLTYKWSNVTRTYIRQEYAKYDDRKDARTIFGAESEVAKNTVAYNEYRLYDAADGSRNQQVIGLRNKFMLGKNITGNLSGEYLNTLSGTRRQGDPDAFAVAAGLEFLPKDDIKITTRMEYRNEKSDAPRDNYLGEFGLAYRLSPDYALLFKEKYSLEDMRSAGERATNRTLLGVAYRPRDCDIFNAFGKVEYKHEKDSTGSPGYATNTYIGSVEGVYQARKGLQLIGKYAGKFVTDDGFRSYTDFASGRVLYDITENYDFGAEYRLLSSRAVHSVLQGGSIEFGRRIIEGMWVSAGYSFDKFDSDLVGDSYQGRGPYLRLRFKFDESTLKRMKDGSKGDNGKK